MKEESSQDKQREKVKETIVGKPPIYQQTRGPEERDEADVSKNEATIDAGQGRAGQGIRQTKQLTNMNEQTMREMTKKLNPCIQEEVTQNQGREDNTKEGNGGRERRGRKVQAWKANNAYLLSHGNRREGTVA